MRIGLIGLGRIGVMHAELMLGLKQVNSVVLADAVPGRADTVAAELGGEPVA